MLDDIKMLMLPIKPTLCIMRIKRKAWKVFVEKLERNREF